MLTFGVELDPKFISYRDIRVDVSPLLVFTPMDQIESGGWDGGGGDGMNPTSKVNELNWGLIWSVQSSSLSSFWVE